MLNSFINNKVNILVISLFVVIGLVSSEFIVLDEEALIAGCFIAFVLFFSQVVGKTIAQELDDRSNKIAIELQKSLEVRKNNILLRINYLSKQESLSQEIESLYSFLSYHLANTARSRKTLIESRINDSISQQFKFIVGKEQEVLSLLQNGAIESFSNYVLEEFKKDSAQDMRSQLLEESIAMLRNLPSDIFSEESK